MYHWFVERKIRQAFAEINDGRYENIVKAFASSHRHTFFGIHALGGVRTNAGDTKLWYERIPRLIPDLRFEVHDVIVKGMPWNTVIMAEWTDHFTVNGTPKNNHGVHRFHMKWGKVTDLAIYCDTQKVAAVMAAKAKLGQLEAAADVIGAPAP